MLNIDLSKCVILGSSFDACRLRCYYLFGTDEGLNFAMEFYEEQAHKIMKSFENTYSNLGRADEGSYSFKGVKDATPDDFVSVLPHGEVKEVYDTQLFIGNNRVIDTIMVSMPNSGILYVGFDEEEKQWWRVVL